MQSLILMLFVFSISVVGRYSEENQIKETLKGKRHLTKTEMSMENNGYVDVLTLDKSLKVSLMYTRPDNFTGRVLYDDLTRAYLHPLAAGAVVKAQKRLQELRPDLSLKIYDAARPMSIQKKMWDVVKNTGHSFYVSNPANGGGLHNYGLAVDITLCRLDGDTIPMGTKVDNMTYMSHIDKEEMLLRQKKISMEAYNNRLLLREVMRYAGFKPLKTEWWHFNLRSRAQAKKYFKVIK
nr:M15 family metallopeptidase [Xylanibacter muris]